jgi:acetyl esterase/lipase
MAYRGKEIVYTRVGSRDLKLDLYRPEGSQHLHAAVLLLHGGAWRVGDRSTMDVYGGELARQGFTAVAPEYRLLGEAVWPAQIADVKAAVRWTRAHAEALEIHPGRIAVEGFSAGAHLALMAGGTPDSRLFGEMPEQEAVSDQVNAVIAFFPPIAFAVDDRVPGTTPASVLLGESATEKDAIEASPLSYVSEAYPPTFLLHGTADQVVPCTNSIQLFGRLQEKGVFVELHLYPGHTHEFARLPSMLAPVQAEIALFLKRAVVNPEVYVRENRELNMFAKT